MKYRYPATLFIFLLFFTTLYSIEEKPFVIIIPSHNNEEWYRYNLNSVFNQKYSNFRVIYVTDAPTDQTEPLVDKYIREKQKEDLVTIIKNKQRRGYLACFTQAANLCKKDEILIDLDGNDWLAHDEVLSYLNQVYSDPDVWVTYGQFFRYPNYTIGHASPIPPEIINNNSFRHALFGCISHLRTFYAGLFHEINKEDLLWNDEFIPKACDLAYMFPILELSGTHSKFLPDVLYIWNNSPPVNAHKGWDNREAIMDRFCRNQSKYQPLSQRPTDENVAILERISNPLQPTIHDYRIIQEHLSNVMENEKIRLIGSTPDAFPKKGIIAVNSSFEEKENCILLYASFNGSYPDRLVDLIKKIQNSDFSGHILYQIGGWPNVEGGALEIVDKSNSFKIAILKEAQRLGYQRALWLDCNLIPLIGFNAIFEFIQNKRFFAIQDKSRAYINATLSSAVFFGLTLSETKLIPPCSTHCFGIDLTNRNARRILEWWYRAAKDRDAYFAADSDQSTLSTILYLSNIDLISVKQEVYMDCENAHF